jgi:hypothetical protein
MQSGSRIRVTTVSGSRVGTLISAATDSIWLVSAKDSMALAVPTQSVVRLEHSLGQRPATGRGALIGALIGAGTGLLLGILASTEEGGWYEVGAEEVLSASLVAGGTGAVLGALIGSVSRREKWQPVPLAVQGRKGGPGPTRVGLRLRR